MAIEQNCVSPKYSLAIVYRIMKPLFTRCLRGAVLGMMLLLSAMAGMMCFSYDADDDESTPPVTVEFNGVVPERRFDPRVSGVVRRQDDRLEQDRLRGSHRRA